jgi:hypothetical protein
MQRPPHSFQSVIPVMAMEMYLDHLTPGTISLLGSAEFRKPKE